MDAVRAKGYSHWDGALRERRFPWWPITRTGVQLAFRKKFFRFVFALAFMPPFIALAGLYVSERLEDFKALVRSNKALLSIDPAYFKNFMTNGFSVFSLLLVLVLAAAGLIADDLRHNSLQLYFARPLGKKDYIAGKMSVIAFFVLILTALPYLVLIVFKLIFAGNLKFLAQYPWLPLSVVAWSALLTVFLACFIMLLSATSRSTRYVSILIFTTYLFSAALAGILRGIFRTPYMGLFSIPANLQQAGAFFFGQKPPLPIPAVWSFAVLGAICVLALVVLDRKIRGVEVIK
jgi:ABC-type transport system involved in multi-copper enzyme maturation permease subunit